MKRIIAVFVGLWMIIAALGFMSSAQATQVDVCTPADAWTEESDWVLESPGEGWYRIDKKWVVDVEAQPAQGDEWIHVDNPDYVPAWVEYIHHDAEFEYVEHPAVYETHVKWVKKGGPGEQWLPEGTTPDNPSKWNKTSNTKQVLVTEAWTEEVVVVDPWVEEVEHAAEGEPTIKVKNPDYVPAVEQQKHKEYRFALDHDAVECEEETPTPTPTPEPSPTPSDEPTSAPEPSPTVEPSEEPTEASTGSSVSRIVTPDVPVVAETLAETGASTSQLIRWWTGAMILLGLGVAVLLFRQYRLRNKV